MAVEIKKRNNSGANQNDEKNYEWGFSGFTLCSKGYLNEGSFLLFLARLTGERPAQYVPIYLQVFIRQAQDVSGMLRSCAKYNYIVNSKLCITTHFVDGVH